MAASYPSSIKSFTTKVDNVDDVEAEHINSLQEEVVAIETALGANLTNTVVQVVNTQTGAVATGTTAIPYDDSIPQNTEGDEYMTLAITPKSATNVLKIDVVFHGSGSGGALLVAALFQDSTAGALASSFDLNGSGYGHNIKFTYWMIAGTTSETTFKVRAGYDGAATTTFNGISSARKFGGVMASSIIITEIKV